MWQLGVNKIPGFYSGLWQERKKSIIYISTCASLSIHLWCRMRVILVSNLQASHWKGCHSPVFSLVNMVPVSDSTTSVPAWLWIVKRHPEKYILPLIVSSCILWCYQRYKYSLSFKICHDKEEHHHQWWKIIHLQNTVGLHVLETQAWVDIFNSKTQRKKIQFLLISISCFFPIYNTLCNQWLWNKKERF